MKKKSWSRKSLSRPSGSNSPMSGARFASRGKLMPSNGTSKFRVNYKPTGSNSPMSGKRGPTKG